MKSSIIKRFFALLVVLSMTLTLAACGGSKTETKDAPKETKQETKEPEKKPAEKVTLRFAQWGLSEKATEEVFKKMASSFEAANPNVKVEFVSFPYGDLKQQVLTMAAGGDVPDVVQISESWLNSFIASGYVAELDGLLNKDYIADIYPNLLNDMKSNNKLYAVPWIVSPYVLFYNKELFKQAGLDPNAPPKTYDEIISYGQKLSKLKDKDGNPVFGVGETTGSVPVSGSSILRIMLSFGGDIWDNQGQVNVNTKENIEAFKYLKTLYDNKHNPESAKLKDLRNLMAIGRLGMYFDQVWGISGAYAINADIKSKVAVAPPPASSASEAASTMGAHLLSIMNGSKNKDVAAKFVEFITSKDTMINYYKSMLFISPRKSVASLPELNDDFIKPAVSSVSKIKSLKKQHPNMENAYLEITSAAQAVTIGKKSPEEAVKNLDAKLKEVLK